MQATFVSQHVLRGHVLGKETFAHGTLRRVDGLWRIEESHYATDSVELTLTLTGSARRTPDR
ncbi:hypothetical protein V8J83_16900 [Gymnodinialimonas sp. 2307UL20-7]